VGSWDNKLYAVNPDGSKKWEFITGNYVISSPALTALICGDSGKPEATVVKV